MKLVVRTTENVVVVIGIHCINVTNGNVINEAKGIINSKFFGLLLNGKHFDFNFLFLVISFTTDCEIAKRLQSYFRILQRSELPLFSVATEINN